MRIILRIHYGLFCLINLSYDRGAGVTYFALRMYIVVFPSISSRKSFKINTKMSKAIDNYQSTKTPIPENLSGRF